uniref:Myosin motor domain-containing protein n=1 Tax=Steinernema glaseri TaxID=37863 RepID=A0A1I7YH75_9BILA
RPIYEIKPEVEDVFLTKRSASDFYRSMFKRTNAQKRERIVMDALGGDFLVRKRSYDMERRR